jgi:hypothetical protein
MSPITQAYTRRDKNLSVDTYYVQTMQGHETYASPIEPDLTTESLQSLIPAIDLVTPSPHIPTSLPPSQISDLDLSIALRKAHVHAPTLDIPSTAYISMQPYP